MWRECFLLAWDSFQQNSIPVGAVLVDGDGGIVARGRNRRGEPTGPHGELAGSNLAHAEVNALAKLPPGDYPEHVLYSTLEPCFLCTAALRYSHVGTVRFAAPDPVWAGIAEMPRLNPNMARRWARRDGPAGGPLQQLAVLLHLVAAAERDVNYVLDCHEDGMPDLVRAARKLAPTADGLRTMPLAAALDLMWPSLGC